jgi:phage-related protein
MRRRELILRIKDLQYDVNKLQDSVRDIHKTIRHLRSFPTHSKGDEITYMREGQIKRGEITNIYFRSGDGWVYEVQYWYQQSKWRIDYAVREEEIAKEDLTKTEDADPQ